MGDRAKWLLCCAVVGDQSLESGLWSHFRSLVTNVNYYHHYYHFSIITMSLFGRGTWDPMVHVLAAVFSRLWSVLVVVPGPAGGPAWGSWQEPSWQSFGSTIQETFSLYRTDSGKPLDVTGKEKQPFNHCLLEPWCQSWLIWLSMYQDITSGRYRSLLISFLTYRRFSQCIINPEVATLEILGEVNKEQALK